MSENLKKFLELVSKDETLKKKVLDCNEMEKEDAIRASIALAKEVGIELSEADFSVKETGKELLDDEMEAVAGGGSCGCILTGGDGLCLLTGGGSGTD